MTGRDAPFQGMKMPGRKPDLQPRELRDASGWYVLVEWGDRPSEQLGGFPSKEEAQQWIDQNSAAWLRSRFEDPMMG